MPQQSKNVLKPLMIIIRNNYRIEELGRIGCLGATIYKSFHFFKLKKHVSPVLRFTYLLTVLLKPGLQSVTTLD